MSCVGGAASRREDRFLRVQSLSMNRAGRKTIRWGGWGCGAIATLACCALLATGAFRRLDNYGLDFHFRHFSTIDADDRIVMVDIDDGSLEAVGDWPWPRRRHAEIVRTLDELGADHIALDLVFSDPSPVRIDHVPVDGVLAGDSLIDDDQELERAIASAGNVYLAMYGRLVDTRGDLDAGEQKSERTGEVTLAREAARKLAVAFLDEHANASWSDFALHTGESDLGDHISPARLLLRRAYQWAAGRAATLSKRFSHDVGGDPPRFDVVDPVFPLAKFVREARAVGFVAYLRDSSDGVVREVPATVGSSDHRYTQFAFAIASRLSSGSRDRRTLGKTMSVEGLDFPVGENELTLINWHVSRSSHDWRDSFTHIPAARLLEIADARRAIAGNGTRLGIAMAKLVEARFADTPSEYGKYVQDVNAWLAAKKRLASAADDQDMGLASVDAIRKSLDAVERDAKLWLKHRWGLWADAEATTQAEKTEKAALAGFFKQFGHDELAADLHEKNQRLKAHTNKLVKELGVLIDGKICLVGYTASAQGDLVATPVHAAMPGAMVHANIVNMLLQDRVPVRAPLSWNLAMFLIVGLVVTVGSGARGWETGVAAMVVVVGLVAVVGATLFATRLIHLATIPAIATGLMTWAVVTTWRQSTAERTRRNLTRALTQYASPAVASRIAGELNVTDLSPESATVSCFFCDLAGFTAMSEKLGPGQTRDVLNPYLAVTSEELVARGALVNKFIGDGVFAFFNAPILQCDDHATRACEAALSIRRDVAQLDGGGGEGLVVRIGVATGEAFVGDYGSGVKLDYTCIGDTVNVGSRLERAAKVLGASILVDKETRDGAGAGFVFRSIGKLRVQGRQRAVEAFELLDPAWARHASRIASVERLAEAIRCFQCCQWDTCLTILGECRDLDPSDLAPTVYARAVETQRASHTSQEWDGALDVGSA
jgi:class 3 adenylate cyclase/CHASE2 domain-containing sensor protein